MTQRMNGTMMLALVLMLAVSSAHASAQNVRAAPDPELQAGFHSMYSLDFAESERHFDAFVRRHPADPLGYAAQAARVVFTEFHRLGVLDAEFYVDDKKLLADTKGKPDAAKKKLLFELTGDSRKRAEAILQKEPKNTNALFALAMANGLEADYTFMVEKERRAAAKPGREGYDYARKLLAEDSSFYDAYIWTGTTNYVVAVLPWPIRWLAKLGGYPGSKDTAIKDLRSAADNGGLLKPYARILLAVTYLREDKKKEAREILLELSAEFPANPLFGKHAARLAESGKRK